MKTISCIAHATISKYVWACHFTEDICRCIFVNEKSCILIKISMKFAPNGPIDNNPALVQILAWHRVGDKPLSEPMLIRFTDAYMRHYGEMSYLCNSVSCVTHTTVGNVKVHFIIKCKTYWKSTRGCHRNVILKTFIHWGSINYILCFVNVSC